MEAGYRGLWVKVYSQFQNPRAGQALRDPISSFTVLDSGLLSNQWHSLTQSLHESQSQCRLGHFPKIVGAACGSLL